MKRGLILIALLLSSVLTQGVQVYADEVIAHGSLSAAFSSFGRPSLTGDWQIITAADGHYLQLSDNFRAKKGPDVKIFLSPLASDAVTADNAVMDSVFVALLTRFKGQTRIRLPSGIDVKEYQSLVFHCQAYTKLWGQSAL